MSETVRTTEPKTAIRDGMTAAAAGWGYRRLVRPVLFRQHGGDPEQVHEETLRRLATLGPASRLLRPVFGAGKPVSVAGIEFPGQVGLAAGMDKNGIAARSWAGLGFGFAELGTVTAVAQPGNDRPRLFRLPSSQALVNRMGFNNEGAAALAERLERWGVRRGNRALGIPIGISIGKTKTTPVERATEDYLRSAAAVRGYADYLAVNVSSPNTPDLRTLQDRQALTELLTGLIPPAGRAGSVPVFVKIAPDLSQPALDELLEVCETAGVAGVIAGNTTLGRDRLRYADLELAGQSGGLSGAPLTVRARELVGYLSQRSRLPVIGVGGVMTAADGEALLDSGAVLLQLYTGFIYSGPGLVAAINRRTRSREVTAPAGRQPSRRPA